jgi:hypothetical protein
VRVRCPPLFSFFFLNYFHPFLQHQMTSWLVSEESWDFGMSNICYSQKWKLCMDRMSDQNLWWHGNQNYWMVTESREKDLCWLNIDPMCAYYCSCGTTIDDLFIYIFQGPKANSSRNQNINLWQDFPRDDRIYVPCWVRLDSGTRAAVNFADEDLQSRHVILQWRHDILSFGAAIC